MSEKRRALGRGLGALIPSTPAGDGNRPVDVFFKDNSATATITIDAPRDPAAVADEGFTGNADGPAGGDEAAAAGEATTDGFTGNIEPQQAVADDLAPVPGARFAELPVRSIRPNPRQPRQVFDEEDMAELVHSIREIGVLQPVVVRAIPAEEQALDAETAPEGSIAPQFELIMGERRWRATQEAGLETIPAIVKDTKDDDLLRDALLENLHRSQLNALEEAAAYQQLLDDFGCTHDQLAGRIGRSRPQISNTLRLLKLPPLVARRVAAGVLSAGHARALLALSDAAAMERLAQRIVAEGLSVRNVEEIVALGGDEAPRPARRPRAGNRHPQLDDLAARLSDRFDTRVSIALGQRKGKLTVEFASMDDLNRIIDLLGTPGEDVSES
ncbi:ParB/RepB/Spo0J family partition protein [Oryzihumus leptocrescens]|uniref:ParB family chromosome partitioning protein n=1 Tax=Oryzihumus leptocrescens TaxID=297536 RepID=A0A542Z7Q2_9MICO|nr:ParB/RepB/Spo0J family partition protein [Oryzihumus leptocrescens]TQL56334.1 ParB family chromosome partitioning protein [Oryzihumus leptocrescens]